MPDRPSACKHMNFDADVRVCRMEEHKQPGKISGFMAEIKVHCTECGKPFQFLGLAPGLDTQGARVSIDGLEANIAISPEGERPNPLQRLSYNVGRFDA